METLKIKIASYLRGKISRQVVEGNQIVNKLDCVDLRCREHLWGVAVSWILFLPLAVS